MKAIETIYAGCRFRSRLEARWAVFFDHLRIMWEYEPEGFELPSGRYLPDFKIHMSHPHGPCWFEVKPPPDPGNRPAVDPRWPELYEVTGLNVRVAFGMHRTGMNTRRWIDAQHESFTSFMRTDVYEDPRKRIPEWFPHCELTIYRGAEQWSGGCGPWHDDYFGGIQYHMDMWGGHVIKAYDAASSARFEFGENG